MGKLTNNNSIFISKVHEEISTPPFDLQVICYYQHIESIGNNRFSIYILKNTVNNKYRVFKKYWDTTSLPDNPILFDLQNTGVITKELIINKDELLSVISAIQAVKTYPQNVSDKGVIVLDGIENKLEVNFEDIRVKYNWNAYNENHSIILPIIESILQLDK
jgi:hypothetical protein